MFIQILTLRDMYRGILFVFAPYLRRQYVILVHWGHVIVLFEENDRDLSELSDGASLGEEEFP